MIGGSGRQRIVLLLVLIFFLALARVRSTSISGSFDSGSMPWEGFSFSGFFLSSLRSCWSVGCFMGNWMANLFAVSPLRIRATDARDRNYSQCRCLHIYNALILYLSCVGKGF